MDLCCRIVRARGRVQGVGFRDSCQRKARQLGITGWVRNRMDDSVEALLQGSAAQLDAMCAWLREDVPYALVEDLAVTEVRPPFARHDRFERLPTV